MLMIDKYNISIITQNNIGNSFGAGISCLMLLIIYVLPIIYATLSASFHIIRNPVSYDFTISYLLSAYYFMQIQFSLLLYLCDIVDVMPVLFDFMLLFFDFMCVFLEFI
jgi:hypothetical protein